MSSSIFKNVEIVFQISSSWVKIHKLMLSERAFLSGTGGVQLIILTLPTGVELGCDNWDGFPMWLYFYNVTKTVNSPLGWP